MGFAMGSRMGAWMGTEMGPRLGVGMGSRRLLGSALLERPLCRPFLSLLCGAARCRPAVASRLRSAGAPARRVLLLVSLPEPTRLLPLYPTVSDRLDEGESFSSSTQPIGVMAR